MNMPDHWHPWFDEWTAALQTEPEPCLARALVHKARPDNVLVGRVEAAAEPDRFAVQLRLPLDHAFFFEHPVDHVPGLMLIEAGRQTGIAVAHRFFAVPLTGYCFFINDLVASFTGFAELDAPVFGNSAVTDVHRKRGRLVQMTYTGHFVQRGRSVGTLTGTWTVVDRRVLARGRRMAGR